MRLAPRSKFEPNAGRHPADGLRPSTTVSVDLLPESPQSVITRLGDAWHLSSCYYFAVVVASTA